MKNFALLLFLLLFMNVAMSSDKQYQNCRFKFEPYLEVCQRLVKRKVSIWYVNKFLLSFKSTQRDWKSFKLFQPQKIVFHAANEKRANNALVKYIPEIVRHLKRYSKVYQLVEKKYQVNREIIAAILMKETRLGKIKPSHDAFIVFNTMVRELNPETKRSQRLIKMAKSNLVSIIQYCYEKKRHPNRCFFPSSYAGAVGIPQFMPQNFKYIESYRRSIGNLSNMNDAIVSVGRFLQQNARFGLLINWSKIPTMSKVENDWYDYDFKTKKASFAYAKSSLTGKQYQCFSCEQPKLKYLREYIKKIMIYNHSSNYAVGVMRLAYEAWKQR
jgi:membrane-bound lytic murein transglycosylase B